MIKVKVVYGNRIRQARELRGITQIELANRVGVKQAAISQMEKDEFEPSEELLKAISNETGFLPSFFSREPVIDFSQGSLSFRAKRSISSREETKAYQYAKIIYEQTKRMVEKVTEMPPLRLPHIAGEKIERSAEITRSNLGIAPDVPIKNLIELLEKNGVFCLTLPIVLPKLDAFSTWAIIDRERPIIVLSSGKPMDRMRFSISHELGHLVLHHPNKDVIKETERQANIYASEFLLPTISMKSELTTPISLTSLARMKVRWGVSMQAIIYRARDLKIINDRQFKYLFSQLSAHGWRTREPANLDVQPESPQLVRAMIETVYKSPEDYALDMGMTLSDATEFYVFA
jgi:Zn-dependent peptidase ImmA (M78 family)/transcriptional regulator with XRE-family HTH domain